MTLVQLRHLISVAQTGSFSRSAEAMHLTQPALSRSVRALDLDGLESNLSSRQIDAHWSLENSRWQEQDKDERWD